MSYSKMRSLRRRTPRNGFRRLLIDILEPRQMLAADMVMNASDGSNPDSGEKPPILVDPAESVRRLADEMDDPEATYADDRDSVNTGIFAMSMMEMVLDEPTESELRILAAESGIVEDSTVQYELRTLSAETEVMEDSELIYMTMVDPQPCEEMLSTANVAAGWHNSNFPADVNGDGALSPMDALAVIIFLSDHGVGETSASVVQLSTSEIRMRVDVNNDGTVAPLDLLIVINRLNGSGTSNDTPPPNSAIIAMESATLEGCTAEDTAPSNGLWEGFPDDETERHMPVEEDSMGERVMFDDEADAVLAEWDRLGEPAERLDACELPECLTLEAE